MGLLVLSGSRRDVKLLEGFAVQIETLGVEAEGCDVLDATGITPTGVWR